MGNENEPGTARAWVEINTAALRENAQTLKGLLPPGCELMPAVKADAYGHGAVITAQALGGTGVRAFCTATAAEGAALRQGGVQGTILVLGYTHPQHLADVRRHRLTQTIVDLAYARSLNSLGVKIQAHLAVDTGMHRIGVGWQDDAAIAEIFAMPNIMVTGMYTHLCADETLTPRDSAYTAQQAQRFWHAVGRARSAHGAVKAHILGSYGLLNYPQYGSGCAYARVGIALYGMLSTAADTRRCPVPLRPVAAVRARVATVRALHRGESLGYGLAYTARRDMQVATIAIGYADGVPRALSCGGAVLLHGKKAPVTGRICMDQMMVDVTGIPQVRQGDTATIIGRDGNMAITACELADATGTISNEILSRLGARLPRIAVEQ